MGSRSEQAIFEPINQRHAIVETVFFCEFDPPLAPTVVERLMGLEHEAFLKAELPDFNKLRGVGIQLNKKDDQQTAQVINQQNIGFERKKVDDSGRLQWILRVVADSFSVHCLDYTEWDEIWPKAKLILHAVIGKIGVSDSSVSGIGLKYVDRFAFEGKPDKYNLGLLFNPDSNLLNSKAFGSGPRWHCHIGWFDESVPGFDSYECLNQLNLDSAFAQFPASNEQKWLVTVDHTMVIRGVNEELPSLAGTVEDDQAPLSTLMAYLHDANKSVLSGLLTEKMSQRISLNKKGCPYVNTSGC